MSSFSSLSQPIDYFRSERLVYRAWEIPDDVDWFHEFRMDAIAVANSSLDFVRPVSRADVEAKLKNFSGSDRQLSLVICLPEEGNAEEGTNHDNGGNGEKIMDTKGGIRKQKLKPIGSIGLMHEHGPRAAHNRAAMIGLNLISQYRNKGYGSEAIGYVLRHAFQILGLHRVAIGTASYNTGAVRLYDRLGFVRECCKRQALWYNGEWHDLIEWSILEDEWREQQRKKAQIALGDKEVVSLVSEELRGATNVS